MLTSWATRTPADTDDFTHPNLNGYARLQRDRRFRQDFNQFLLGTAATPLNTDYEVYDPTRGVILTAPNGTRYRMTMSNAGTPVYTAL